ncbi:MAG: TlpA disulfide reductase family protein [Deltaproteobacteria bacterium]
MLLQLRSRKKLFLLILVSAAAFVFFSPSLARLEGGELKDFTLLDVNGHKVRLFELANDKPLLLYFWASWCKPCRLVSPQIATLAREYKDRIPLSSWIKTARSFFEATNHLKNWKNSCQNSNSPLLGHYLS